MAQPALLTVQRRPEAYMIFRAFILLLTVLLVLGATPATAEEGGITARIQKQYESLKSFQADIVQELTNGSSKETRMRKGNLAFRSPGHVRWETVEPEPELIVAGDGPVWDYFADEETAYKYPREQVMGGKTMLRFLSGQARLDEDFWVEEHPEGPLVRLELVPKEPEPNLVKAEAWVTDEMAMLTRVKLVDFFGNINDVRLENLVLNPDLPDAMFAFTPPAGTDIEDNTQQ